MKNPLRWANSDDGKAAMLTLLRQHDITTRFIGELIEDGFFDDASAVLIVKVNGDFTGRVDPKDVKYTNNLTMDNAVALCDKSAHKVLEQNGY